MGSQAMYNTRFAVSNAGSWVRCNLRFRFRLARRPITVRVTTPEPPRPTEALERARTIWSCRGKVYYRISKGEKSIQRDIEAHDHQTLLQTGQLLASGQEPPGQTRIGGRHGQSRLRYLRVQAQSLSGVALSRWARGRQYHNPRP